MGGEQTSQPFRIYPVEQMGTVVEGRQKIKLTREFIKKVIQPALRVDELNRVIGCPFCKRGFLAFLSDEPIRDEDKKFVGKKYMFICIAIGCSARFEGEIRF